MARADLGDLGKIILRLEERGRLIRVKSEVDPVHDLAGVAAKLEGRPAAVLFERVKGHEAPVFTGLYWSRALLADLLEQPEKQLPAYRLRLHQGMAAEAHAASRGGRRPRARGNREPGRSFEAADPDPCAPGRRPLLRCRRGDRQGPGHGRAQRLDPALHGDGQGPHEHQHRCRAPPRDLPREGRTEGGGAAVHAQRRRRPGRALRGRDALGSGADRHRRARHREHLPGCAAGAGPRAPSPRSR